ncbi:MAG: S8 family serine peptidase [Gammaproteobacteria bacterium]|nr:S8 family serine peptidase [Gammaproteobacteria bacterium]
MARSILPAFTFATLLLAGCASTPPAVPGERDALALAARADASRFIVIAVANEPGQRPLHAGSTPRGYADGAGYLVSDGARRALRALERQYHLQSVAAWPIGLLHLQCAVYAMPAGGTRERLLARLQADGRVALAEPLQDYSVRGAPPDPYAAAQSGNARMDISAAHRISRGRGIRIALIDTGLASDHPDLRGRVDVERNFVDDDARRFQLDRHGTAIAGVIAANADNRIGIAGVAPESQLLALKACWQLQEGRDEARCNSFTLAQALASAIELKANIINLSLSGPPDRLLEALAERAMRAGIIIVGPDGEEPSFPGSLRNVLGVARSEDQAVPPDVLQAPGREVLTLAPGGRYDFSSGSSIATGEITGVTALLLARRPELDARRVHALLRDATDTVATAAGPARTVNACRALESLTGEHDCLN